MYVRHAGRVTSSDIGPDGRAHFISSWTSIEGSVEHRVLLKVPATKLIPSHLLARPFLSLRLLLSLDFSSPADPTRLVMTGAKQVFAPRHPLFHDDPPLTPELVGPSKFAVTWPAEPSPPIQSPGGHPMERSTVFSSSEADSDLSEREISSIDKHSQAEFSDDYESSPNHRRCFQQQFGLANTHDGCSDIPRPSRTFPAPLPSQLEHLQNPHRTRPTCPLQTSVPVTPHLVDGSHFYEVSLELADSVEMVVQTLLQIAPAQILDPVKEQYAACSLSVPTSCLSAVFTTMKNLNFVSANMPELCARSGRTTPQAESDALVSSPVTRAMIVPSDFDVGEMLQGVGDALSGCAAQRGVDLVLVHADVGLKHVAVRGEEFGLSNTLTHVSRLWRTERRHSDGLKGYTPNSTYCPPR